MEKINFDSSSSKRIIKDARDNIHKKAIELLCHHLSNGNEIIIYTNCNESYKNICLSGYRTNIKLTLSNHHKRDAVDRIVMITSWN